MEILKIGRAIVPIENQDALKKDWAAIIWIDLETIFYGLAIQSYLVSIKQLIVV